MKTKTYFYLCLALCGLLRSEGAFAQGTAFTYQGQLNAGGGRVSGSFDFTFGLYATNSGGVCTGNILTNFGVAVSSGVFSSTLDFSNVFDGTGYWLEIGVRTNGGGNFTILSPRQQLAPVPYAIAASNLTGTLPASQLSGTVSVAQLPIVLLTNNAGSVSLNGAFYGNGSGLANIPESAVVNLPNDLAALATLPNITTAGTFGQATVNAKGLVTSGVIVNDPAHGGTGANTLAGAAANVGTLYISSFANLAGTKAAYPGQMIVVNNGLGGNWPLMLANSTATNDFAKNISIFGFFAAGDPYGNMPPTHYADVHTFTVNGNIFNQTNGVGTGVNSEDVISVRNMSPGQCSDILYVDNYGEKQLQVGYVNDGSDTYHAINVIDVLGNTLIVTGGTGASEWDWGVDGRGDDSQGAGTGDFVRYKHDTTNYSLANIVARIDGYGNVSAAGTASAASMVATNGFIEQLATVTNNYVLTASDSVVLINGNSLTATLPSAAAMGAGKSFTIKLVAPATTARVVTSGSQTLDGATAYSLSAQYKYLRVISDGSQYLIMANN